MCAKNIKEFFMVSGVEKIKAGQQNKQRSYPVRAEYITVKQGNTLTSLAKEFGMSVSEFKQWAGLDKNTLTIGQKIELPTAKAQDGKGIYAIAREYGMTMGGHVFVDSLRRFPVALLVPFRHEHVVIGIGAGFLNVIHGIVKTQITLQEQIVGCIILIVYDA
jgi:LysM repeat protein